MMKKTQEEIEKSKNDSCHSLELLKMAAAKRKKERKDVTESIKRLGLKLAYFDPISIAYAPGPNGRTTLVTFTIRSRRDQFCRAKARVALVKHLSRNTNTLEISTSPQMMKEDLEVFASILMEDISKYVENNHSEVPNYFRKAATLERKRLSLLDNLNEKVSLMSLMRDSINETRSQVSNLGDKITELLSSEREPYVLLP
jgi:hypothetical protein